MSCSTSCHPRRLLVPKPRVRDDPQKIARLKFQAASKNFDAFNAANSKIAAVQRGWRDFRMAQSSFERADPRCQKIGRRRLSRCREGTVESFR
jgi:hypothetical protein